MNKKNFWKKFLMVATCAVCCLGMLTGYGSEKIQEEAQNEATSGKLIAYGESDPQVSGQQIIAEEKGFFKALSIAFTSSGCSFKNVSDTCIVV